MANPFSQRATEYLRDDVAFLQAVTPDPLITYFRKFGKDGRLFNRLVKVVGTPGCGKTTLAMLLEYSKLQILKRNFEQENFRPIIDALQDCALVNKLEPVAVTVRLPMESDYRNYWELPYDNSIRHGLVKSLIQSRAVIGWLRSIMEAHEISINEIKILPRAGADAALHEIGGPSAAGIFEKAKEVERSVYSIGASLVPPSENEISGQAKSAYWPFEVFKAIEIPPDKGRPQLTPHVILDDAHTLHQAQYDDIESWLIKREMHVARWLVTRFDREDLVFVTQENDESAAASIRETTDPAREATVVHMQGGENRIREKKNFRKMALNMSSRKLSQMPVFAQRNLQNLGEMLSREPHALNSNKLNELKEMVMKKKRDFGITDSRFSLFENEINSYFSGARSRDRGQDVKYSMINILMCRYANRVSPTFFQDDLDPKKPLKVSASEAEGARFHLFHHFGRPKFYGFDALADGSGQNAEIFLHLANPLVNRIETKLIQGHTGGGILTAAEQDKLLRNQAKKILFERPFPRKREALKLVSWIAKDCLEKVLEPNASLGDGANAAGIPQNDFDQLMAEDSNLEEILKFSAAYNMITILRNRSVKKKQWCCIELSGPVSLTYGLPMSRGGFVECTATDLAASIESEID